MILGAIVIVVGALMISKTEAFLRSFGRINFFETHLGVEGGSRLGYKLIGILALFIGMLLFTGMIDGFLNWLLGPLMRYQIPA